MMDFSTIKQRVQSGQYADIAGLRQDCELMCTNAMLYVFLSLLAFFACFLSLFRACSFLSLSPSLAASLFAFQLN